jgi:transposase
VQHLIPPAKRGGRRREVDEREVLNGLLYVLSTGCQWRYIPRDLPPRSTLFDYFQRWEYDGTLLKIHYELYQKCRELVDRQASPTACVIDSQSVKSAEKGGAHIDPSSLVTAETSDAESCPESLEISLLIKLLNNSSILICSICISRSSFKFVVSSIADFMSRILSSFESL